MASVFFYPLHYPLLILLLCKALSLVSGRITLFLFCFALLIHDWVLTELPRERQRKAGAHKTLIIVVLSSKIRTKDKIFIKRTGFLIFRVLFSWFILLCIDHTSLLAQKKEWFYTFLKLIKLFPSLIKKKKNSISFLFNLFVPPGSNIFLCYPIGWPVCFKNK